MIDLRSDTVTRPSTAMLQAMVDAPVGDDVFNDDPTVQRLEAMVAERLDKEAAVFVTSGTQSNLVGLLAHCGRGDEYIVGDMAHCYRWEGGGAAVLGSIQPQPIPMLEDGLPDPTLIGRSVKPDDPHFARSKVFCVENTKDGMVLSVDRMGEATSVAREHGLRTHLDGARMWNAAVSLGIDGAELTQDFDTVSLCLSKGLGTPMGSVLSGPVDLITEARKWRKMLGGGLRQVGVVAAAGIYAMENNIDRLANDHATADAFATTLAEIDGVKITAHNTNMIFLSAPGDPLELMGGMETAGVKMLWSDAGDGRSQTRVVTHLDISEADVAPVANSLRALVG
ncbi:MAG: low-specificity L-threonine aldolase [Acidimicrobiales bacterium]|nr:low-specificity L-threonine aldolase [Acidimicrobiales bacterium]